MNRSPDRLYELLPAVYRRRDAENGYPVKALLRVISEQVNLVEADIGQMYENWFIETCEPWAVPYVADLVGYDILSRSGEPSDPGTPRARELEAILAPRRDAARTIRHRQSKGPLAQLELIARSTANLPVRAVEFFKLLGWSQAVNFPHPERGRTLDVRNGKALELIGGPFEHAARSYDVRRAVSRYSPGRAGIPGIGIFAWRLKSYPVTNGPAYCVEDEAPECYTFNPLGYDTQLYNKAVPETDPAQIAGELNLPVKIGRRALEGKLRELNKVKYVSASGDYYDRSLAVFLLEKNGDLRPVPKERVIPANLSDWGAYRPKPGLIAVDPQLGRIVFPKSRLPKYGVRVSFNYAFGADIGGGEYSRRLSQPRNAKIFRVGPKEDYKTINAALAAWKPPAKAEKAGEPELKPSRNAVIEIRDSGVYTEPLNIDLGAGESLQIRAAKLCRPVLRLLDNMTDLPDAFGIKGGNGSRFTLDGLIITGRSIRINNPDESQAAPVALPDRRQSGEADYDDAGDIYESPQYPEPPADSDAGDVYESVEDETADLYESGENEPAEDPDDIYLSPEIPVVSDLCDVTIRHCTLVPGRNLHGNCEPQKPDKPSLRLEYTRATVNIEHSILGRITVQANERASEPSALNISDSILDATGDNRVALGAGSERLAYTNLTIVRSTVIGMIMTHAITLAENCFFTGLVTAGRRLQGCVRFCYVPPGSRTPRRFECQPETAESAIEREVRDEALRLEPRPAPDVTEKLVKEKKESERQRVEPGFNSLRYGNPAYCQLAPECPGEISKGADDESEMGVFHDLYQPQRAANLRARMDEFTPADAETAIIYVN